MGGGRNVARLDELGFTAIGESGTDDCVGVGVEAPLTEADREERLELEGAEGLGEG